VDGGGTQTRALVADLEGNVLARGLGPGSNHHRVGFDRFSQAVTTAVEAALRDVQGEETARPAWATGRIASACFGLAGVDTAEDAARISTWVRTQRIAPRFTVLNDSELILAAGTPEGWGVVLISGTGSVCLGRSPQGRKVRVGGWGPLLGDEGSGYQIALRGLQAATQAADGRGTAEALLQAILRRWSLPDAEALIPYVHSPTITQADIAALATVVLDLADHGDATAAAIRGEAVAHLAGHLATALRLLGLTRPPLALAGGLMRGSVRRLLLSEVEERFGEVAYVAEPSIGGVVLARRLLAGAVADPRAGAVPSAATPGGWSSAPLVADGPPRRSGGATG